MGRPDSAGFFLLRCGTDRWLPLAARLTGELTDGVEHGLGVGGEVLLKKKVVGLGEMRQFWPSFVGQKARRRSSHWLIPTN